jgi:pilus assembly protein Flp/PilA
MIGAMSHVWPVLTRILELEDEDGQTLVEYGLLIAMLAILVIVALIFLGPVLSQIFQNVGTTMNAA